MGIRINPFETIYTLATLDARHSKDCSGEIYQQKLEGYASSLEQRISEVSVVEQNNLTRLISQIERTIVKLTWVPLEARGEVFKNQLNEIKRSIQNYICRFQLVGADLTKRQSKFNYLPVSVAAQNVLTSRGS